MQKMTISTSQTTQILDITKLVNDLLIKNCFEKGLVNLFPMHTTCALAIAEVQDTAKPDFLQTHKEITKGISLTIPVESATMVLGYKQKVHLLEYAGPRERRIMLTFIKET